MGLNPTPTWAIAELGAEPARSETGECQAPPTQCSPPGIRGLVTVTAVVMAAVIVFATVFFTGRPDTKPFVGAFAAHLICPL